jgi:uncharacterized protein YkwD
MFLLWIFIIPITYAEYNLSEKDKHLVKNIANKITKEVNNKTPRFKTAWEIRFKNILKKKKTWTKSYELLSEILKYHMKMDLSVFNKKQYSTINIKQASIERYWLNLHNNARKTSWLRNYSYDPRLTNTAIEWSYNNYDKWNMDHKRDSNDWWYDYHKIENWFQERGINCKVKWRTTTSESIAKYGFYCKDWECSDELKKSLNVIFDIYMNEKTLSYPANAHYKAIVSPNISKMWLWLTLYKSDLPDYYEYYVTTHYCTEFK